MIAQSHSRVAENTAPQVQAEIDRRIECNVHYFAQHSEQIEDRLRELDDEWDVERVLGTNASALSLFGLTLGILGRRRWLLLPLAVQSFFLQHALQGWCPPIGVLRRLGVRTRDEILRERYALKALRGDFRNIEEGAASDAIAAAE